MSKRRSASFKKAPSVIVNLNVPRELNRFIPSAVYEPRISIQQDRYRHRRVPVVRNSSRGVVRRSIKVFPRRYKRYALSATALGGHGSRLIHRSYRSVHKLFPAEMHRRRYKERKSRRGRVSDGHLQSVRKDHGLLQWNTASVEALADAALVQRAVFGDY